ncbi:ubiquitin-activating enzyme-like protein [Novymonas esmeraldas]|uniref:Ubiquitin-activating enzyme-like protein n=1 Tax=Novymonas esmeraldas TaxID=1808958 RepID=A0AAW0FAI6_9TRYP
MHNNCGDAVVVTASIGHVVLPWTEAAAALDEPARKRTRAEPRVTSTPEDVVFLSEWSEAHIRGALHDHAVHTLRAAVDAAEDAGERTRALAVLHAVSSATSRWVRSWPAVRIATTPVTPVVSDTATTAWTTALSFSYVPSAFSGSTGGETGDDSDGNHPDAPVLRVLAALTLPRVLRVSCGDGDCVVPVLTERVPVRPDITAESTPPNEAVAADRASLPAAVLQRPVCLVGAGGIGCEVLKVLVLSGFTDIHVIDLDTIDATNLNRQLLFTVSDVGAAKAETARRAVLRWCAAAAGVGHRRRGGATPPLQVVAYHNNITAPLFSDEFFARFAAVVNALDNVAARQHVNRMCMRRGVPLVESGTMGYNGQTQPIVRDVYECYDCRPKPPDTVTFAVCTIHARPTTMVHCVHYAKELYEALFGGATSDAAETHSGELGHLRAMVGDWRRRHHSSDGDGGGDAASAAAAVSVAADLLRQLFIDKIADLLSMKSEWSTAPPTPLSSAEVDDAVAAHVAASRGRSPAAPPVSGDHVLATPDCMALFLRTVVRCLSRPGAVAFAKEDTAAVHFVSAAANLRAHVFHIPEQTVEEVRSIAGSIVPAIATTNAIIAGAVVHELMALLRRDASSPPPHVVYARKAPQSRRRRLPPPPPPCQLHMPAALFMDDSADNTSVAAAAAAATVVDQYLVHSTVPNAPNRLHCPTCQDVHPEVCVCLDLSAVSLGEFVHHVLEGELGLVAPSVSAGPTVLYEDEDYEVLAARPLAELLLQTAESAEHHADPTAVQRYTLTADALNRDVPWAVVLLHDTDAAVAPVRFRVSGVERAVAAERRALDRRARQPDAASGQDTQLAPDRLPVPTASSTAAVVVDDGDDSNSDDDDDDDVAEVE